MRVTAGRIVAIATGCAILMAVAPAFAFVRYRTDAGVPAAWCDPSIAMTLHVKSFPDITAEDLVGAAMASAAAWSSPHVTECGTSLQLHVRDTSSPDARIASDGENVIVVRTDFWGWHGAPDPEAEQRYDPSALAMTTVTIQENGRITDADMELNATAADWTWNASWQEGALDLQGTLTHEMGHVAGLQHTCIIDDAESGLVDNLGNPVPWCDDVAADAPRGTMYPLNGPNMRILSSDEALAICNVYPRGVDLTCPDAGCACSTGRARHACWASLLVGIPLFWRRRRRGRHC